MYLPVGIQTFQRDIAARSEHGKSSNRPSDIVTGSSAPQFAVKGYDATSVREICEAAGITKPTLYHFFGSKDGVLQALVQRDSSSTARWWMPRWPRPARSGTA